MIIITNVIVTNVTNIVVEVRFYGNNGLGLVCVNSCVGLGSRGAYLRMGCGGMYLCGGGKCLCGGGYLWINGGGLSRAWLCGGWYVNC